MKEDAKILWLSLQRKPFEVMITLEKQLEFRKPSKWILSRLYHKSGKKKEFHYVGYRNGYSKKDPFFIVEYITHFKNEIEKEKIYSNGLEVKIERGDVIIATGNIVKLGNIKIR